MKKILKGGLWILLFTVWGCGNQEKAPEQIARFIDSSVTQGEETQSVELNWILVPDTFFVEVYVSDSERDFTGGTFLQKNKLGAAVIEKEYADKYFHLVVPGQDSVVLKLD